MAYTVTLDSIWEHNPCAKSWQQLLASINKTEADDTEVSLEYIFDLLGLRDTLWALRALPAEHNNAVRLLVCDIVTPALQYADDPRPAEALQAAQAFVRGKATARHMSVASAAARAAFWNTTQAASAAARAAAQAARRDVKNAAWDAAWDAAIAAVWAAREAARDAARGASPVVKSAASTAAGVAAWNAAIAEQKRILSHWLKGDES